MNIEKNAIKNIILHNCIIALHKRWYIVLNGNNYFDELPL